MKIKASFAARFFSIALIILVSSFSIFWGYVLLFLYAITRIVDILRKNNSIFLLMTYVAVTVYFSIAPALQYDEDITYWGFGAVRDEAYFVTLVCIALFVIGAELFGSTKSRDNLKGAGNIYEKLRLRRSSTLLALLSAALFFGMLFLRPSLNFTPRGLAVEGTERVYESILLATLPKTCLLIAASVSFLIAMKRRAAFEWIVCGTCLSLALIGASPLTTARQILIIGLMPLLLALTWSTRRWMLVFALWIGIAGAGPFINFIARGSFYDVALTTFPYSVDFDAVFVSSALIDRTGLELGYGRYLLSAFSFFLPRELKLFPDFDPLQSSFALNSFDQTNLSLPPFITAFFDFGFLGPILLGSFCGLIFSRLENSVRSVDENRGSFIFLACMIGAYVPFLRGPILGWGPFAVAGIAGALILTRLCFKRKP